MIVEQFLSGFHSGDAVGNSVLHFHKFLIDRGIESRIVALTIDPDLCDQAVYLRDYRENPRALKIYHFAIASPLSGYFARCPGKKILLYHNVTPSHFFAGFSPQLESLTREAREELKQVKDRCDFFIADSLFNAGELRELGVSDVFVFPVMIDDRDYDGPISHSFAGLFQDGRKNLLFVGRITPNKKIEDLIKILSFYRKFLSPEVRLIVAGNTRTLPRYYYALRDLASRLQLAARDLLFTDHLPMDEFLAAYRTADVFVSMSEHEGFCLPLIESCRFGLPVVAYAAGAVGETLAGAGLLLARKDVVAAAVLIERVLNDVALRERLRQSALQRFASYQQQARPEILLSYLEKL
jgi:glycosyltransferase involved in cell wall biosynthesis